MPPRALFLAVLTAAAARRAWAQGGCSVSSCDPPGCRQCSGYNSACCNATTQDCLMGCVGAYHESACVPHGWQCCGYGTPFDPKVSQCCAQVQPGGVVCDIGDTCCGNSCCSPPSPTPPSGRRLALAARSEVYGHNVTGVGPMLASVRVAPDGRSAVLQYGAGSPIEVRNMSGFEVSGDGVTYTAAPISANSSGTVTLTLPAGTAASLRYLIHDTPCANKNCAVYGSASGLPSPPLVANLPGHAGADPVGLNLMEDGRVAG